MGGGFYDDNVLLNSVEVVVEVGVELGKSTSKVHSNYKQAKQKSQKKPKL